MKTFKVIMIITTDDEYFKRNGERIEEEITSGVFAKEIFGDSKEVTNVDVDFELMEKPEEK